MVRPEARNAIPLDGWRALEQDRVFDDLLGSEALFQRLSAHRNRPR
jgi:hypothetical protein